MLGLLRDRLLASIECPNPECPGGGGNRKKGLSVRYLRGGGRIRYLHCHDCGAEFSERKGTPLWGLRIQEEKAFELLQHIAEGCGIRKTARLCKVNAETVIRLEKRCGTHFKRWHDTFVRGIKVHEAQLDEKWSFVGKKTEELRCDQARLAWWDRRKRCLLEIQNVVQSVRNRPDQR